MRRYAYLRISQKEPFDIPDFAPSMTLPANLDHRSWSLIPEAVYTAIENLELRLRFAFTGGDASTEFREKPIQARVDLRARYYF